MNTQTLSRTPIMVKIGASRQVAIPKKFHDALRLKTGDFFEIKLQDDKIVMSPKIFMDKYIGERIAEGLDDIKNGRTYGPFKNTKELMASLHKNSSK